MCTGIYVCVGGRYLSVAALLPGYMQTCNFRPVRGPVVSGNIAHTNLPHLRQSDACLRPAAPFPWGWCPCVDVGFKSMPSLHYNIAAFFKILFSFSFSNGDLFFPAISSIKSKETICCLYLKPKKSEKKKKSLQSSMVWTQVEMHDLLGLAFNLVSQTRLFTKAWRHFMSWEWRWTGGLLLCI